MTFFVETIHMAKYGQVQIKPIRLLGFTSGLPCQRIIYYNAARHGEVSCK